MRARLPLRLLPWLCLLLPSLAFGQESQARRLAGVWVEGEVLRALEAGERREVGCFLRVEAAPLQVLGTCGREVLEWPVPALLPSGQSAVRVRSGFRSLVLRTGTPNELELREGEGMQRLYRVPPPQIPTLRRWVWAEQRLVGRWKAEDGAVLELHADGSFAFEQEEGSYEFRDEVFSEGGAWGMLTLQGERERRYLLHGEGGRLALAELPADLDYELQPVEEEVEEEVAEPSPSEGGSAVEVEEPAALGGFGFFLEEPLGESPPEEKPEALPPWLKPRGAPLPTEAELLPGHVAAVESRLRIDFAGAREVEPTLSFEQELGPREPDLEAEEEEEAIELAEEAEPQASEPILPPGRICGCEAGQSGWAWLALLSLFFVRPSRRSMGS